MTVRLLNVPQQTVSDAICRFKELDNDGRRSGSGLKRTVHNSQNDRIWCVDAPSISAIVEHRQYPKSVMVWGAICASGKTPLGFVEEGVKINKKMCQGDIIEEFVRGGKAFRKCQLDASTRLCTSLQGQKDTRVVQGDNGSEMDSDDEDQDITFDFSAPTQWGMRRNNMTELGEPKKDILYYLHFSLSIANTLIHGLLKKPSPPLLR
ncbi:uncharacterized protein TNCV_4172691 [Trichonephila clavipes]|nr:uncharacterized protein TNCV_4172691 [Trichonephila clavipes]